MRGRYILHASKATRRDQMQQKLSSDNFEISMQYIIYATYPVKPFYYIYETSIAVVDKVEQVVKLILSV